MTLNELAIKASIAFCKMTMYFFLMKNIYDIVLFIFAERKNMPKLKTININGCNLLSCHELQYLYGHQAARL